MSKIDILGLDIFTLIYLHFYFYLNFLKVYITYSVFTSELAPQREEEPEPKIFHQNSHFSIYFKQIHSFSHPFAFYIGSGIKNRKYRKLSDENLATLPAYLRFNEVSLIYNRQLHLISSARREKCGPEQIQVRLEPLVPKFTGSKLKLYCDFIGWLFLMSKFGNLENFLQYIDGQLLTLFKFSRAYEFDIDFIYTDQAVVGIPALLKMSQIMRSSSVKLVIRGITRPTDLPEDAIMGWITHSNKKGGKKETENFLQIKMDQISNGVEICDRLNEVFTFRYKQKILNEKIFVLILFRGIKKLKSVAYHIF